MDILGLIVASLINVATGCDALPATVMRVGGQEFMVMAWTCPDRNGKAHVWRTWQRECVANNGAHFWSRPYFLEDTVDQLALYVNQFGEAQGGFGATIEQAHVPPCGS